MIKELEQAVDYTSSKIIVFWLPILAVTGKCCTFVQSLTLSQNVVENRKQKTLKRKEVTHIDALSELKINKSKSVKSSPFRIYH